jgi:hypothetical protein
MFMALLFTSFVPNISCLKTREKVCHPSFFIQGFLLWKVPRFSVLKNPCNLDPWGHYSSIIEWMLLLDKDFQLSLPERLSLIVAMDMATSYNQYLFNC